MFIALLCSFLLSGREPLELSALLRLHTSHLPPIDLVKAGQMLRHGSLLLPLVAQHLMDHVHLRHGGAALAGCLANLGLLPRVLLAVFPRSPRAVLDSLETD